jgi:hypothetical protein
MYKVEKINQRSLENIHNSYIPHNGARGSVVVKALGNKPEGREFDTRWGDCFKFT